MSFRKVNEKWLAPGSQIVMIVGIVMLCQPWSLFLHRYGLTVTLVGLVAFMVTGKIGPHSDPQQIDAHEREGQSS